MPREARQNQVMGQAIGEVLPLAIGVAISPVPINVLGAS